MGNFDPYLAWLDIPNDQRPATNYRLLGIRQFENDPHVIASAADRVLNHLLQFQHSAHAAECGQLMREVQAAKACLLNAGQKAQYDETLKQGRPAGTAGNLGAAGQDSNMFPPARPGQEQQIGQAPPVPGSASPSGGGRERQIIGTPPVPGGAGQERKLAPPPTGPVPDRGGETQLRPPPSVPAGGQGGVSPGQGLPPGQQIASPGPPSPTGPSAPIPGPVGAAKEQPLSGPAAPAAGAPGGVAGSTPSRPMPRGAGPLSTGPGPGAPSVPLGPGGPAAGGRPGGGPYVPAGTPQPGTPMGRSPEQPIQPGSVPVPQMGPGMQAPGQVPGQPHAPTGPVGQHPYGQMPVQPGQGYPATPMPGGPTAMPSLPPAGTLAGPPVHPPQQQGGRPSWAPEERTGRVGQSVANAVAGQKSSGETTNYANREGRTSKTRRKSSATYQALVIVLAGAILLFGFILALLIAHYLL